MDPEARVTTEIDPENIVTSLTAHKPTSDAVTSSVGPDITSRPAPTRSSTVHTTHATASQIPARRSSNATSRFRASVRKVILVNRGTSALSQTSIGAEPGVDPRHPFANLSYGHIHSPCVIDIVDYNAVQAKFMKFENKEFEEFLSYGEENGNEREKWAKVRWINVGGISWDVISTLAVTYDIHPLALEDILQQRPQQSRSKADYYSKHLFIRILRHTLGPDDSGDSSFSETVLPRVESPIPREGVTTLPRSTSPVDMQVNDGNGDLSESQVLGEKERVNPRLSSLNLGGSMRLEPVKSNLEQGHVSRENKSADPPLRPRRKLFWRGKVAADGLAVLKILQTHRVNVEVMPLYLFLFRDGTVISINATPDTDFTAPILARLRQKDSGLRATADPSLLLQSLLDLVVDQALEVVDAYQSKILKLEHDILIKPKMKTVQSLHVISGDLTLHRRTLEPIKTLIYALRRYDVDRCAAMLNSSGVEVSKVEGFLSHQAKVYLADVYDHIDYIISGLDMFSSISENLINYTFNMASYEMNQVMQRLTLATITFLPLTLLTGYFGMNFASMWSVQRNSDALFWKIAVPVELIIVMLFCWTYIEGFAHYCKKRWTARQYRKAIKLGKIW